MDISGQVVPMFKTRGELMRFTSRTYCQRVLIRAASGVFILGTVVACMSVSSKPQSSISTNACAAIEDSLRHHLLLVSFEIDYKRTAYLVDFMATFGEANPNEYYGQLNLWIKDNRRDIDSCLKLRRLDSDSLQQLFEYRPDALIYSTTPSIDSYRRKSLRESYLRLLSRSSWTLEECAEVLEVKRRF